MNTAAPLHFANFELPRSNNTSSESQQSASHFSIRLQPKIRAAFRQNELNEVQAARAVIEKDYRLGSLFLDTADFRICSDLDREMPRQIDIDRSKIMALQLHAHETILSGDIAEAEKRLREASDFECSIDVCYGPPQIREPWPELYADWLFEQGHAEEAADYYQKSLERAPERRLSSEALKRPENRFLRRGNMKTGRLQFLINR